MANEFAKLAETFWATANSDNPEASLVFDEARAGQAIKRLIESGFEYWTTEAPPDNLHWIQKEIGELSEDPGATDLDWSLLWRSAAREIQSCDTASIPPVWELVPSHLVNWRVRAKQSAAVCEWLAENLQEDSSSRRKTSRTGTVDNFSDPPLDCYVTLWQMAGIVNRQKRTLERLSKKGTLPPPDVQGTGGKPSEWRWTIVRPILEAAYSRKLPVVYPADRFVRS